MEKKEKYIKVSAQIKKDIAKDFNVSLATVCSALTFKTQSAKAMTLRAAAMNRGGKLLVEDAKKEPVVL